MAKLSFVVLKTHDLEKSREFYETLGLRFGYEQHDDGPPHYACKLGTLVLELYHAHSTDKSTDVLGFTVSSLETVLEQFKQKGHDVRSTTGYKLLHDPDGRIVLLNEQKN